jgi:ectoine hydroxylase
MTPDDILAHSPRVLSQAQRERYFATGFLAACDVIPPAWLDRLIALSDRFIEDSRNITASNEAYNLGPNHGPQRPHVRRLRALIDRHPDFWGFASDSVMADIAADLVGPDVKFHSSKLNYKWPGAGEIVKWHQDIPAWPHTNYSPVTLGVYLCDVPAERGPLTCVAGSHRGPIFEHRDERGAWTGAIRDSDIKTVDMSRAEDLTGPAGTVIAINCRTMHASRANLPTLCGRSRCSSTARPMRFRGCRPRPRPAKPARSYAASPPDSRISTRPPARCRRTGAATGTARSSPRNAPRSIERGANRRSSTAPPPPSARPSW